VEQRRIAVLPVSHFGATVSASRFNLNFGRYRLDVFGAPDRLHYKR